jgi:uncharacterized protein
MPEIDPGPPDLDAPDAAIAPLPNDGGSAAIAGDEDLRDAGATQCPLRTCIVARTEHQPDDLIRFVAGPDGSIVPDLARRLPGRGVWVTLDRKAVATAVKTKAFSRALKRQVTTDPALPDMIDRLMLKRAVDALSIANKAGQFVSGFAKVEAELMRAPLALLHAVDAAEDGCHKLDRKWQAINADPSNPDARDALIFSGLTIEQLSLAIGRENVVHACLRQGGAASRFVDAITRLMRYRTGDAPQVASDTGRDGLDG